MDSNGLQSGTDSDTGAASTALIPALALHGQSIPYRGLPSGTELVTGPGGVSAPPGGGDPAKADSHRPQEPMEALVGNHLGLAMPVFG